MKKKEKVIALELRRKGYSLNEISQQVRVSKGTASAWVKDVRLNKNALSRIMHRSFVGRQNAVIVRKRKRELFLESLRQRKGEKVRSIVFSKDLKALCCSLLYWCEGGKKDYSVRFVNSDPLLIRTFLRLFRSSFPIDEKKFRACMHLHSYHEPEKQKKFWSNLTGIPEDQFLKTYRKSNSGLRVRPDYPGCISIRYNDPSVGAELEAIWKSFRDYMGA